MVKPAPGRPEMAAATASATAPVTLAGLGLYLAGLAFVIAGMSAASLGLFLAGTVVGGLAVGALFIGSLSTANGLAPAEGHAQVLSRLT